MHESPRAQPSGNALSRIVDVLFSPTRAFHAIARRPTWLVAMLVLTLAGAVPTLIAFPKVDLEQAIRDQLGDTGQQLSAEQLDQQLAIAEKFSRVAVYVGVAVGPLLAYLVTAVVFFLVLKVAGSESDFRTTLSVTVHSAMPWVVAGLLTIPVALGRAEIQQSELESGLLMSHLGFLAGDDGSAVLRSLLSSVDLFSFWSLALLTLGFSITGRIAKGRAAACAVGTWLVYVAGKTGLAAVGQMFT